MTWQYNFLWHFIYTGDTQGLLEDRQFLSLLLFGPLSFLVLVLIMISRTIQSVFVKCMNWRLVVFLCPFWRDFWKWILDWCSFSPPFHMSLILNWVIKFSRWNLMSVNSRVSANVFTLKLHAVSFLLLQAEPRSLQGPFWEIKMRHKSV